MMLVPWRLQLVFNYPWASDIVITQGKQQLSDKGVTCYGHIQAICVPLNKSPAALPWAQHGYINADTYKDILWVARILKSALLNPLGDF